MLEAQFVNCNLPKTFVNLQHNKTAFSDQELSF